MEFLQGLDASFFDATFFALMLAGFVAQLIDGSLGMGFGVISATILGSLGVPPAAASAAVHAAKAPTTFIAGTSHFLHGNFDRKVLTRIAIGGVIGAILGATLLVNIPGNALKPWVGVYLFGMGVMILYRAVMQKKPSTGWKMPLVGVGGLGGFLDAIGGGGWGPVTSSTLMGGGHLPRPAVGSVSIAEFAVTIASLIVFAFHFTDQPAAAFPWKAVAALVAGGVIAAPMAGWLVKIGKPRLLLGLAGGLVVILAAKQVWDAFS